MGLRQSRAGVQVLAPAESVEQVQLRGGQREPPVLVLPEEGHQPPAERGEVGRRRRAPLHEGPRAALSAHPACEDKLVQILSHALAQVRQLRLLQQPRRQLEYALHVRLRRARPHDSRPWLPAQQQIERMRQDRLASPRLARDGRQAVSRPQLGTLDQEQVLYAQLEQHPLWCTSAVRRSSIPPAYGCFRASLAPLERLS